LSVSESKEKKEKKKRKEKLNGDLWNALKKDSV